MSGKKVKLLFTMSDGTVQTAEFTLPFSSGGGIESITVGSGLTGSGTAASPLKLNLMSSDERLNFADVDGKTDVTFSDDWLHLGSTALTGDGSSDQPLTLYLSPRTDNLLSAEGGLFSRAPHFGSSDSSILIDVDGDDGSIDLQLSEDAITYGSGLTGRGTEDRPVKVALTSVDGSVTITPGNDNTVNLAVNDSLQSLMPKLIADQKPQPLTPGTFKGLADAYKNDRSTLAKPFQKSFKSILEDMGISSHITIMPAVDGKQLYVDGPVEYEPNILMRVACYYIPYDSSLPVCTLFERDTIFAQATSTVEIPDGT